MMAEGIDKIEANRYMKHQGNENLKITQSQKETKPLWNTGELTRCCAVLFQL